MLDEAPSPPQNSLPTKRRRQGENRVKSHCFFRLVASAPRSHPRITVLPKLRRAALTLPFMASTGPLELEGLQGLKQLPVGWTLRITSRKLVCGLSAPELAFVCPATGTGFASLPMALRHAKEKQPDQEQQKRKVVEVGSTGKSC